MPDLDAPAVAGWLRERGPDVAAIPVAGPVDADPPALRSLLRLGGVLDDGLARDAAALGERLSHAATLANLRAALPQVGPARLLLLLDWITGRVPGGDEMLAALTESGPEGDHLRAYLQVLHRKALLARIFSPERLRAVAEACRPDGLTGDAG